ncbi:hypothetical protein [Candidatus Oscillochloris fontis]|uniref:hypothetical protein n=1 Tax=Candidatus Oscillochloris fontis TaxID=2496868 RepID=UPI00101CDFF0|nr:hypothetical protein [Candidatus Oscillochloris fontis]
MAEQIATSTNQREADSVQPNKRPVKRYARIAPLYTAMIWTSFLINVILFIIVGVLAGILLTNRGQVGSIGGSVQVFAANNIAELQDVVTQLEAATIRTTIPLSQPLSLAGQGIFVPVDQVTSVILTQPVPLLLSGADIDLGNGNRLRANNISLTLPEGTPLQIALKMDIPLDSVIIPVQLDVPVSIPLADTELGPQFRRLGAIVDRLVDPIAPFLPMPETPPNSSE